MLTDDERERLWDAIGEYFALGAYCDTQEAKRTVERVVEDIGCRMVDAVNKKED